MNTDAASAHEVLDFLRARQVRRRWDATDWYMALFGLLMLGAALWTSLAGVRLPILSVSWGGRLGPWPRTAGAGRRALERPAGGKRSHDVLAVAGPAGP
ncbi:MAG: hypothetical protein L0G49_12920 [Luteococcus sp.]|uniref:hypothetical protein n=1 Tax=Luteococcus sp. TaxID=1969402 RepID=UPI002649F9DF|nr:hypothetical protein [Luteococcus sp.]MDN5564648.1 hypothetical protein [Luteococcus sp.]